MSEAQQARSVTLKPDQWRHVLATLLAGRDQALEQARSITPAQLALAQVRRELIARAQIQNDLAREIHAQARIRGIETPNPN